jgi:DNA-binding PadR family transcriptional regulator
MPADCVSKVTLLDISPRYIAAVAQQSGTANVILGMLGWRPMSGYEIKSIVDTSTRLFWAASYGQIYPELRRLEAEGLIEGKSDPHGGRRRNVYRLTPAGRSELRAWLGDDDQTFELRDEGLLKLFFAGAVGGQTAPATLRAKQAKHEQMLEQLRAMDSDEGPEGYAALVLRFGIEFNEWQARWCERAARELEAAERSAA